MALWFDSTLKHQESTLSQAHMDHSHTQSLLYTYMAEQHVKPQSKMQQRGTLAYRLSYIAELILDKKNSLTENIIAIKAYSL